VSLVYLALIPPRFPEDPRFNFKDFYSALSARGCCIYPGKVSDAACFRIGSIGDLHVKDMQTLLDAIAQIWPPKENDSDSAATSAAGLQTRLNGAAAAPPAVRDAAAATGVSLASGYTAVSSSSSNVKAVVFDWAGTTVDFGSRAPLMAFLEMFRWAVLLFLVFKIRPWQNCNVT
jgi:hypothetical protein